jgi:hypothetical protein
MFDIAQQSLFMASACEQSASAIVAAVLSPVGREL